MLAPSMCNSLYNYHLRSGRAICVHYDVAEFREDIRHVAAHRIPVDEIVMPPRDELYERRNN